MIPTKQNLIASTYQNAINDIKQLNENNNNNI